MNVSVQFVLVHIDEVILRKMHFQAPLDGTDAEHHAEVGNSVEDQADSNKNIGSCHCVKRTQPDDHTENGDNNCKRQIDPPAFQPCLLQMERLFQIDNSILIALGIAIFDILPVLGSYTGIY